MLKALCDRLKCSDCAFQAQQGGRTYTAFVRSQQKSHTHRKLLRPPVNWPSSAMASYTVPLPWRSKRARPSTSSGTHITEKGTGCRAMWRISFSMNLTIALLPDTNATTELP